MTQTIVYNQSFRSTAMRIQPTMQLVQYDTTEPCQRIIIYNTIYYLTGLFFTRTRPF